MVVVDDQQATVPNSTRQEAPPTVVPGWLRRVCAVVFPAPQAPQRFTLGSVAGILAGFAAACGYLLVLPAGRTHLSRIWAGDGAVLLDDALRHGAIAPLFTPYHGYLHLLPRLAALPVAHLPIGWWATGLVVAATLLRAGMAVLVYAATAGHLPQRLLRVVIAGSVVALPAGNVEAIGNLTNLHWFAFFTAFWVLLWRPAYRWQSTLATVVLPLCVLSTPVGLLLAPLAAARLALPRRRDRMPAVATFIGLAVGLSAIVTGGRPHAAADLPALVAAASARGPLVTLTGPELTAHVHHRIAQLDGPWYWWPAAVATLLVVALAGVAVVGGDTRRRFLTVSCLLAGTALIGLNLALNWSDQLRIEWPGLVLAAQRFSVAPCLFLFTAVALGVTTRLRQPWQLPVFVARGAVVAVVALSIAYQWYSHVGWLTGPTWDEARAVARQECLATGARTVEVPVTPATLTIHVACADLR